MYLLTLKQPKGISFTLGNVNLITNAAAYQVWYNYSVLTNTTTSDFFGRPLLSLMRGLDEAICMEDIFNVSLPFMFVFRLLL